MESYTEKAREYFKAFWEAHKVAPQYTSTVQVLAVWECQKKHLYPAGVIMVVEFEKSETYGVLLLGGREGKEGLVIDVPFERDPRVAIEKARACAHIVGASQIV